MEMSIDKAISWLISIAEHEGEDIPIYDTDVEAIKVAIDTMRKLYEISRIANRWKCYGGDHVSMREIYEVLNGNDD